MENFQSLKFGGFNVSVAPWDKLPDIASKFTAMHEEFSWVRIGKAENAGSSAMLKKMCVFEGVEVAQIDIRHIYIILDSLQFQTISIYVLSSRCIIMMIDDSYVSLLYVCKCVIDCVWGNSITFFR